MLHDGSEGDGEGLGEARDGEGSGAEPFDDGAAGGIAEGVKNAVDCGLLRVHEPAFRLRCRVLVSPDMETCETRRRAAADLPHSTAT